MTITTTLVPPSTDNPATFDALADNFVADLVIWTSEANATALAMNNNSLNDTSATSNTIPASPPVDLTFTVSSGKSHQPGGFHIIADAAAPTTNYMIGQTKSYSGTTLVSTIKASFGSGTKSSWVISPYSGGFVSGNYIAGLGVNSFTGAQNFARATVASAATTADIWGAAGNTIDWTGTTTCTGFPAAAQAGASRKLICASAGAAFTAGANLLIQGVESGSTVTLAANDEVIVEAITTTQFKLTINRYKGESVSRISPITGSVAANALTVTINPCNVDFRSATLTSGAVVTRAISAAISAVLSNGSSLGMIASTPGRIAVLAIDNAGTVEVAFCNANGPINLDESTLISTTAEGGAGAADSASLIYSTTARSNVAFRIMGFLDITPGAAFAWSAAPTTIQGAGGLGSVRKILDGVAGPVVATTSGTTADATGIPIWAKEVTLNIYGVSGNGTSNHRIQLGTAAGMVVSGYQGSSAGTAAASVSTQLFTAGIDFNDGASAASVRHGSIKFTRHDISSNTWNFEGGIGQSDTARTANCYGSVTLPGPLDRIRSTFVNGTDAHDAGAISWVAR